MRQNDQKGQSGVPISVTKDHEVCIDAMLSMGGASIGAISRHYVSDTFESLNFGLGVGAIPSLYQAQWKPAAGILVSNRWHWDYFYVGMDWMGAWAALASRGQRDSGVVSMAADIGISW